MSRLCGWRAAALTLLVVAWTGCSDGAPLQPEPQYELTDLTLVDAVVESTVDVSDVAEYRNSPSSTYSVSTWIGAKGGSLRVLDLEIVVPPGAVLVPTKFRIKLPGDRKNLEKAFAEFEPHGAVFLEPVTLRLPYQSTTAEGQTPSVIWWNGVQWVRYPTTLLPDGRIETTTSHFSFFGTELLDRGITPVGG